MRVLGLTISLVCLVFCAMASAGDIMPPQPKAVPFEMSMHGDRRVDEFFWMKDLSSQSTVDHLTKENDYLDKVMSSQAPLRKDLYREMLERIEHSQLSIPYEYKGYSYYSRIDAKSNYPVFCRKKSQSSNEEIILDVNALAQGSPALFFGDFKISPNGEWVAYSYDTKGSNVFSIHFENLNTGKRSKFSIPDSGGRMEWAADSRTIFFTKRDSKTFRSFKVARFDLSTGKEVDVYQEVNENLEVYIYRTITEKFIVLFSVGYIGSEIRLVRADHPREKWKSFQSLEKGHEYRVIDGGDRFFVLSNGMGAKNFQVLQTKQDATAKSNWKTIIPHDERIYIQDVFAFKDFLVVKEERAGLIRFRIVNRADNSQKYVEFGEDDYVADMMEPRDFNANGFHYTFQSLVTPETVYRYDFIKGTSELVRKTLVKGYDPSLYISKRLEADAPDGAKIPISIAYKRNSPLGRNPALLAGYSAYGVTLYSYFDANRVSLLDRGFVFAIVHARGASTHGRAWYENGKLQRKKNTFSDFIASTEYLAKQGFVDRKRIFAQGESAGGLLMGAVANMRPDLYKGIIANVPFVDVLTTMLDASLPLTTLEYDEWGNPNVLSDYSYIKSYSPYDNVSRQTYPNILATTGLNDTQVSYWEPAKWISKLRKYNQGSDRVFLLKTDFKSGHQGQSARFEKLESAALQYSFILMVDSKH